MSIHIRQGIRKQVIGHTYVILWDPSHYKQKVIIFLNELLKVFQIRKLDAISLKSGLNNACDKILYL